MLRKAVTTTLRGKGKKGGRDDEAAQSNASVPMTISFCVTSVTNSTPQVIEQQGYR